MRIVPSSVALPRAAATPTEQAIVDCFRADDMLGYVREIATTPRPAGSADAKRAAELIRDRAIANGWDARVEPVQTRRGERFNVVADRRGTAPDGERKLVLAGAHLDTVRGAAGANDDASGSAALLAGTKVFASIPTRDDLRFIWFDGEEEGLTGSSGYVAAHREELKRAEVMIVAEMIGAPAGTNYLVHTRRGSVPAGQRVLDAAARAGLSAKTEVDSMAGSDHMPFEGVGIPAFVVASTVPRNIRREDPNYHRSSDTVDKLNPAVFEQAGDLFGLAVNAYAND